MKIDDYLVEFVKQAIIEDLGDGDHTSLATIDKGAQGEAKMIAKDHGVLAGVEIVRDIIYCIDNTLATEILLEDGSVVKMGDIVLYIRGNIHNILLAERLVLNIMQRMSGIATTTREYVDLLKGTNTIVLDTRKTTPLLRIFEKEAVRIGGGGNHRFGLFDLILIKDNHVDYSGGIISALERAKEYRTKLHKPIEIEIEVRNMAELREVMGVGGADRIMLDNFSPEDVAEAVRIIDGRCKTEASGGITLQTIRSYAEAGVDYISVGALTHSVRSLDLSLKAKFL
ncbi:carboxylating nicotinate-nucleotide diphosphorylase [Sphingobacterium siyangense]|uniref:carboxylating nicotinate-nucleotide diphosphorylase n=1 Tax=Sphingobacterium siyangense TaxID=459529 RepID=UPI003C7083B6